MKVILYIQKLAIKISLKVGNIPRKGHPRIVYKKNINILHFLQ